MVFLHVTASRSVTPGVVEFVSFREQQSAGGPLCAGGDVGSGKFAVSVPKEGLKERGGQKGPEKSETSSDHSLTEEQSLVGLRG